jgi:hypothetical protein
MESGSKKTASDQAKSAWSEAVFSGQKVFS